MTRQWTLKWFRPDTAQSQQLSQTPRIAAVYCDSQVLCTTAVTCNGSICWITPPLVSAEPAESLINFLLLQLREHLPETGCEQLLLLIDPAADIQRLQPCLSKAGFQRLAGTAQFQLAADSAAAFTEQTATAHQIDIIPLQMNMPAISPEKQQALQSLISSASADSMDLRRLPPPGFQQQWLDWQLTSATILAAIDDAKQYTGLCVLAADSDTCPLPDHCRMKILWLAVRPDSRRKGVASMLLKAAAKFVMTSPDNDRPVTLSADVDLENLAAIGLYSSCGFHCGNRTLELWGIERQ